MKKDSNEDENWKSEEKVISWDTEEAENGNDKVGQRKGCK